jgi:RNA polymerase sigma-70 factor (family 1)
LKIKSGNLFSRQFIKIDHQTFEKSYDLYWEKVFSVCYHHVGETEAAKEMVQDIFKSLWERREELQVEKIENYLMRAAKFKAFEYVRNKVSRHKLDQLQLLRNAMSSNCTEEQVLYNNLREKVDILVDTLPVQCKRVYKMSREEGLNTREIASMLQISERAVEYHITKAMGRLKHGLAGY